MQKQNKHSGRFFWFVILFVASFALKSFADVRLPKIIGSNMVLQRGAAITIWGWADPGEKVTVQFGENKAKTKANSRGEWLVKLPALESGENLTMTITGKNTIVLENIAMGEVWVCSGQSNMEKPIEPIGRQKPVINYMLEIPDANYPNIRLFHVQRNHSGLPLKDVTGKWQPCTPQSIKGFTAVGYFFGRDLHRALGVPVGLIESSWGGTRSEPWTPPSGFASVPELSDIFQQVVQANDKYETELAQSLKEYERWVKQTKKDLKKKIPVSPAPELPQHLLDSHRQPTGLYNAMIHPIIRYAIRGAIWYQGESNRGDGFAYRQKMQALINGWRKEWKMGDFPFYFVQLAPYNYSYNKNSADSTLLPQIWVAQLATLSIPNTGMAVTTDISDLYDIHPQNKLDVGKRLARWALAKTYGKDIVFSGPIYRSMTIDGDKIRVQFDFVGSGLASRDGEPLNWFEIAGADKKYVRARAEIQGDQVVVSSQKVAQPMYVRFAWHQLAVPNLINKEGLPASSFNTEYLEYGPYYKAVR